MHQLPKFTPARNSTCFGQFLCPSSTPDDGQRNCRKHVDFHAGVIWEIGASGWFYYKEKLTVM